MPGLPAVYETGIGAASSDAGIIGTAHNLLKLWRSGKAPWGLAKARCN